MVNSLAGRSEQHSVIRSSLGVNDLSGRATNHQFGAEVKGEHEVIDAHLVTPLTVATATRSASA
jgi:hypothetical protein